MFKNILLSIHLILSGLISLLFTKLPFVMTDFPKTMSKQFYSLPDAGPFMGSIKCMYSNNCLINKFIHSIFKSRHCRNHFLYVCRIEAIVLMLRWWPELWCYLNQAVCDLKFVFSDSFRVCSLMFRMYDSVLNIWYEKFPIF